MCACEIPCWIEKLSVPPVLFQGRKILEQGRHKKIEHNNKSTNKLLFALNFSLAIAKYNPTSKLLTITQRLLNCLSCVLYVAILAVMASSSLHEHFIFVVWIFSLASKRGYFLGVLSLGGFCKKTTIRTSSNWANKKRYCPKLTPFCWAGVVWYSYICLANQFVLCTELWAIWNLHDLQLNTRPTWIHEILMQFHSIMHN